MVIYQLLKKGDWHPVFCEDFITFFSFAGQYHCFAVMDGCSSGKDSHFASALIGKLFHKAKREILWQNQGFTAEEFSIKVLASVHQSLQKTQQDLRLNSKELLSTCIFMVYAENTKTAHITVIGDGFLALDGKIIEIDQDNTPDYWGYHLSKTFEDFYANHSQTFTVQSPQDITISTDGLGSFRTNQEVPEEFSLLDFLLKDDTFAQMPTMLQRKFNILHKKYGYLNGDDLGVIRVRF